MATVLCRGIPQLLLSMTLLFPLQLSSQVQPPWFGTWLLIPQKSSASANASRYKRVTTRIEPFNDGLRITYEMVGTRGGVIHMEWTGKFDGKDYPLQGAEDFITNAYTLIDDHSYRIAIKVDGIPAGVATVVIGPDGKTLTTSTQEKNPEGRETTSTAVYERE